MLWRLGDGADAGASGAPAVAGEGPVSPGLLWLEQPARRGMNIPSASSPVASLVRFIIVPFAMRYRCDDCVYFNINLQKSKVK